MGKILGLTLTILVSYCCFYGVTSVAGQPRFNEPILHELNGNLTDAMTIDGFSPPMASRVYYVCNVGFYEVVRQGSDHHLSLSGQINGKLNVPMAGNDVNLEIAASTVFYLLGERLVYTNKEFVRLSKDAIRNRRGAGQKLDDDPSVKYAEKVVERVLEWVGTDNYKEMRKMPLYRVRSENWSWEPTPPAYHDALEPNWHFLRTATLDSASQFAPSNPIQFSTSPESTFFREALETYSIVNSLNEHERMVAKFWDCNPLQTRVEGHFKFSAKQMTPGGHWIAITGIAAKASDVINLIELSRLYTNVSIALYDGFIASWECKYDHELIRPETYINRHIDSNWRPILETPPFPEYTSAHSVISMCSAQILSDILGEVTYTDTVETRWGYPSRTFSSFTRAAVEVSNSRVYGGIHYPMGVEAGMQQGRALARHILDKVQFEKPE